VQECPAVATLSRLEPVRIFPTLVSRVLVYVTGNLRDGFQVYDYAVYQAHSKFAKLQVQSWAYTSCRR